MRKSILILTVAILSSVIPCGLAAEESKKVEKSKPKLQRICSQTDAAETPAPKGFKVTPSQALKKAESYFPSNPFLLVVYADSHFYYVDRSAINKKIVLKKDPKWAYKNGIKIDGKTGKVVRGEVRPPAK